MKIIINIPGNASSGTISCKKSEYKCSDSIIIIGGTNNGDSSEDILKACPEFTLYGTDIQAVSVNRANKRLHDKTHIA